MLRKEKPHVLHAWMQIRSYIIPSLVDLFADKTRLVDPFARNGAVLMDLYRRGNLKSAVINDFCSEILLAFRVLKERPDLLIKELQNPIYVASKSQFNRIRDVNPKTLNSIQKTARFLYIVMTCRDHTFRLNKKGELRSQFFKNNKYVVDEENLYAIHEMLKITDISSNPFNVMIDEATPEDFLFLNPPAYTTLREEPFMEFKRLNPEQFETLVKSVHKAHDRGVKFLFSAPNADDIYLNAFKKYSAIIFRTQRSLETVLLVFHNLFGNGEAEIRSL